jgi:ribosomal protein L11 methylase PrmA
VLTHVILQARLQRRAQDAPARTVARVRSRGLPGPALRAMLTQMRRWIARLEPADRERTVWSDYAETHGYRAEEESAKRSFVAEFVRRTAPGLLFDLGCNTGAYAALALEAGAGYVVGFDADHGALEAAFARAQSRQLEFLPLFSDATNPSPDQGWRGLERAGFASRARPDALLALAFVHHLAIGRNVPLDQVLDWLTGLAPCGVIEFVPKHDPTVRRMLALREDIFQAYTEEAFSAGLAARAQIVRSETISEHGRRLFWYHRAA